MFFSLIFLYFYSLFCFLVGAFFMFFLMKFLLKKERKKIAEIREAHEEIKKKIEDVNHDL